MKIEGITKIMNDCLSKNMMVNSTSQVALTRWESFRMSEKCFTTQIDVARDGNFDDRKFWEAVCRERKTSLRTGGMLRGPQHPQYWPTDPDFHLLKYAELARWLPYVCRFAMQNFIFRFWELVIPLFKIPFLLQWEHRRDYYWSSLSVRTRSGRVTRCWENATKLVSVLR